MKYLNYSIKSEWVEEEDQSYYWAEFIFEDEHHEQYISESPPYARRSSDFYCLREDALAIHRKLQAGEKWEDAGKNFRQSW